MRTDDDASDGDGSTERAGAPEQPVPGNDIVVRLRARAASLRAPLRTGLPESMLADVDGSVASTSIADDAADGGATADAAAGPATPPMPPADDFYRTRELSDWTADDEDDDAGFDGGIGPWGGRDSTMAGLDVDLRGGAAASDAEGKVRTPAFAGAPDRDDILDRWAGEEQVETVGPKRNWSTWVGVLVVSIVVGAAVAGAVLLYRAADDSDVGRAADSLGANGSSAADEDAPTLDELTSEVTLPPGPAEGLSVVDQGVTVVPDRFDDTRREGTFAVVIRNPHDDWLAQGVQVSVSFLAADGDVLGVDNGFIEVVLPGQEVAVASLFFDAPVEPLVGLDVDVDVARWRETGPVGGGFRVDDVRTVAAEFSGVITDLQITSDFDRRLSDVVLTAVYRNADGAIIGGYDTFVDLLEPGQPATAKIALLANVDIAAVASTEVYPAAAFGFDPDE